MMSPRALKLLEQSRARRGTNIVGRSNNALLSMERMSDDLKNDTKGNFSKTDKKLYTSI